EGNSFKAENPLAGVKALEINQIDSEHTQILITTEKNIPVEHLLTEHGDNLVLSLNRVTKAQTLKQGIKEFGRKTVTSLKQTYKSALAQAKNKDNDKEIVASNKDNAESDILIPNPEVVINDNRVNDIKEKVFQAQENGLEPTPPSATLPRAVAPPVGDMAVSNINTMPDMVDLGSSALVPRLVLRDAPVREVLALLARSASLNVVYAEGESNNDEETGPTISLDLENQPVQEVFNSVLLVSGLDANRRGNIIYVGEELPAQARNLISRTLRLNQVTAENAALYLASQGATGKRLTTEVEEIIDPETGRVTQRNETSPELSDLDGGSDDETGTKALMLRGLQVSTDGRLNAITLVGEPRKVEVATAFLTQLDARRRQVAVNVKVLDVNLLNQDIFNSSFSFGVDDSFFVQDNGSASLRFGDTSPPTSDDLNSPTGRASNPPAIANPFADANTFLDTDGTGISIAGTTPGVIQVDPSGNVTTLAGPGAANFFSRVAGVSGDPFTTGITDVTLAEDTVLTINSDGTVDTAVGSVGTATSALPSLFQYPDKFLALLEARVTSGNAKILTDPTLMVQEGQQATVKLAQNIIESVKTDIDGETGTRTITPVIAEAGVVLTVNVERVDDNGFVSMSVSPTVSSIGATQNFDSGGGAVNLLNLLSKRELSSGLVRLRDGQTLILSGIIQDQERTTISKVPVLGDIPLLGSLFRSTDKASERAEVIVLLTPEIVEEDAGLASHFSPSKESREVLHREGVGLLGE
ncbi:MAG: secretin N-terminal domain-containing protein, partial [Cyanobacteria bacterium P01_C01_bin.72]